MTEEKKYASRKEMREALKKDELAWIDRLRATEGEPFAIAVTAHASMSAVLNNVHPVISVLDSDWMRRLIATAAMINSGIMRLAVNDFSDTDESREKLKAYFKRVQEKADELTKYVLKHRDELDAAFPETDTGLGAVLGGSHPPLTDEQLRDIES